MKNSPFSNVAHRFDNLDNLSVKVVRFQFLPVQHVLDEINSVFRTLDFSDEFQSQLGLSLWRLRCSVYFGLVPYSHEEIGLLAQCEEILSMARSLPGSTDAASLLIESVSGLVEQTKNPKLDWILSNPGSAEEPTAVFGLMAMRRSFGADLIPQLSGIECAGLEVLSSLDQLDRNDSSTLILPGSLKYLSRRLFMKLFHEGRYSRFHVLLYQREPLSLKRRLRLPESTLFPGLSHGADLNIENDELVKTVDESPYEDDGLGKLLSSSSGGQVDGCSPRTLVFEDWVTIRVANSERIWIWRPESEEKLLLVLPVQLIEGDFVIVEEGNRRDLLNLPGEDEGLSAALNATDIWRRPLQAMLLDHTPAEIARLMMDTDHLLGDNSGGTVPDGQALRGQNSSHQIPDGHRGMARNLATNISNWENGRVYGPGDLPHMSALMQVLADRGYLRILDRRPEEAAQSWFLHLVRLRAGQQAAGVSLAAQTYDLLKERLRRHTQAESALEISLKNGMAFTLHRLAMIAD